MPTDTAFPATDGPPGWQPQELGFGRATIVSGAVVAVFAIGFVWLATGFAVPPPPPVVIRLVEASADAAMPAATMAETTAPLATPPPVSPTSSAPAPELVAPSMPPASLPEIASDLAVVATPDLVPLFEPALTRPAPAVSQPVKHLRPAPAARPAARVETAAPPGALEPVMAPATSPAPVPRPILAAAPDTTSGLGAYQSALHRQIERNMQADHTVGRLGIGGTTVIIASIEPDGRLAEARIARSSGNRAIDQAALGAVQRGGFAAFGLHMPGAPITISVPISVEAD